MKQGPLNLITDVAGLCVGQADCPTLKSGVTVLTSDAPFACGVHVMGGAPGSRETDLLAPDKMVQQVDALVLSGGSAFGLAACDGVAALLRAEGRGFDVGGQRVPIVPGAIIFDLLNGGDKEWGDNPYPALARRAYAAAAREFAIGSVGAGCGAMTATVKGGVGSASAILDNGATIGALAVVNALGAAHTPNGQFWAAPWELGAEFGGRGLSGPFDAGAEPAPVKATHRIDTPGQATTIAILATDARMDKAALTRLATAAHDGMARALVPSHTPFDGDLIFALSTGQHGPVDPFSLGHAGASVLARAIARAVYCARPAVGDLQPTWQDRFAAQAKDQM